VVEGECLRDQKRSASAPREERAAELSRFLHDPEVAALIPPWSGELATGLLDLLDFEALRGGKPKWVLGYQDVSTLLMPLTLVTGWATAHGPNLMDMVPTQSDPLTTGTMSVLAHDFPAPMVQASSSKFQKEWGDFGAQFDVPLQLSEPTEWKRLDGGSGALEIRGRLIGGCFDTVSFLAGSSYGDVPTFMKAAGGDGAILFLENVEQSPGAVIRMLLSLERHGCFQGLSGLLLGRSTAKKVSNPAYITYEEALRDALAYVTFQGGAGKITQRL
jgi:muramoyltetrapeptide carboxypeptidase